MSHICPLCSSQKTEQLIEINRKPNRETNYGIEASNYLRRIFICYDCQVYFSDHEYDFEKLYEGNYNASTYNNQIKITYDKIMSLPIKDSDNALRCKRIINEIETKGFNKENNFILDVGSGLCVFLGLMKKFNYLGYAVDPDSISIRHALENVEVRGAYCGDIMKFVPPEPIHLLTMNKVLEHVPKPQKLLESALTKLEPNGLCYLELPDGDMAKVNGGLIERQEFFIEHYFAFTKKSMTTLMTQVGLVDIKVESIVDPSGKYSLYGFGTKKG